jgi:hypothetical protein
MKYKGILHSYKVIEKGNFFQLYEINNDSFVIYSPEKDIIACMELYSFKDITPYELAVYLDVSFEKIDFESDDFIFEQTCSKNEIIKYLFDIEERIDERVVCRVADNEGVLLHDISNSSVIRNLFTYNSISKEVKLRFNNDICIASCNEELDGCESVIVCFNPYLYCTLKISKSEKTIFLLPAANTNLCTYICKFLERKKEKVEIYVYDADIKEALIFFSFYSSFFKMKDNYHVTFGKKVELLLDWNPVRVMNMVSKAQKECNIQSKSLYKCEDDEKKLSIYQCQSVNDNTLIYFKYNRCAVFCLLQAIIKEMKVPDSMISFQFL